MAYERFAAAYDRLMEDMPYPEWLAFLAEAWDRLGMEKPRVLADLGCGTGSLAIPLAQSGIRVYGIDLSEHMLAIASDKEAEMRRSGGSAAAEIVWLQQDMRELALPEQVDAAFSFCDCLNYLTEEEDLAKTFRAVYDALRPGGAFLFDVHTPALLERYADEQPFTLNEPDAAYIWTCELDIGRCQIEHALTIFLAGDDGRFDRIEEVHVQRAYPLDKLERMLRDAGFGRIEQAADFRWRAPGRETQRAFFAAVK
ncbi:class I SAM-dependent DNA methyltransferase [Paenibacillus thermoaerophilus]|uniref:Class I SAM-dependent DNA methyltransferase n=1 Tax=Paenibacillus thermoaerophilus TaxID=1215385 RepID=A0ABW2UZY2_9BACL|nr:class I SAM-dependent methyltransferase [Paenibacillus thermoaerophilus]TMV18971.1 class I SAM-dependent methyltransferase [Paenibacillus thermoaerophilus]